MADIDPSKDYYRILGVAADASEEELRRAYRSLAKSTHPDTGRGDVEVFRTIQEAYDVLSDPLLQRTYSRQRAARGIGVGAVSLRVHQSRQVVLPMAEEQLLYVMVEIQPQQKDIATGHGETRSRQPLNLAVVIDRSTSMRGTRMQNVKAAVLDLVDTLQAQDRLAIVTFSDRADVAAPSSKVTDRRQLRSAVSSISPDGGTEIYQGLAAGYEQVSRHASDGVISHVLLLTDGRTYGDEELALAAVTRAQSLGIGMSAFGIGEDWHDTFLDSLAHAGGGTSHYVDSPGKVQAVLRERISGLVSVALRRARLRISPVSYVRVADIHRVSPYMEALEGAFSGDAVTVTLGDLSGDESASVVFELVIKLNDTGTRRVARLVLEGELSASTSEPQASPGPQRALTSSRREETWWRDIDLVFSQEAEHMQAEPPSPMLVHVLARLAIFRMQERAWRAVESGDTPQATRLLESAATRLLDLGYRELGQAAMLEAGRIERGVDPSLGGRKKLRYGTRLLTVARVL